MKMRVVVQNSSEKWSIKWEVKSSLPRLPGIIMYESFFISTIPYTLSLSCKCMY